jgi:hypothetical protein
MTQLNISLPPPKDSPDFDGWLTQLSQYLRDYLGLYDSGEQVSFIQSGTGAVTRTTQNKLRDFVSVFDFMTVAQIADVVGRTASVNVAVPVQAALDSGAAKIIFPKGKYYFGTTALVLPNWIQIEGEGYQASIGASGRFTEFAFARTAGTPAITTGYCPTVKNIIFSNSGGTWTEVTATLSGTTSACFETGDINIVECSFYNWYICIQLTGSCYYVKTDKLYFGRSTYGYYFDDVAPYDITIYAPHSSLTDIFMTGTSSYYARNVKVYGGSIELYTKVFAYVLDLSIFGTYFETGSPKTGAIVIDPLGNGAHVSVFGCLAYLIKTNRFVNMSGLSSCLLVSHGNVFEGSHADAAGSYVFYLPSSGRVNLMGDAISATQQNDALYVDSLVNSSSFLVQHPVYPATHSHVSMSKALELGERGFSIKFLSAEPSAKYSGQVVGADGDSAAGWDPLGYAAGRPYLVIWQGDRWRSVSGA